MDDIARFLPLAGVLLLIVGAVWLLLRWERKQASTWTNVAEGELDRVDYGYRVESHRSGAMVHTTTTYRVPTTTVVFADGRSFTLRGRHDIVDPHGARFRVWRNGLGSHRLERLA